MTWKRFPQDWPFFRRTTGNRWITMDRHAELWCILCRQLLNKWLNCQWVETPWFSHYIILQNTTTICYKYTSWRMCRSLCVYGTVHWVIRSFVNELSLLWRLVIIWTNDEVLKIVKMCWKIGNKLRWNIYCNSNILFQRIVLKIFA